MTGTTIRYATPADRRATDTKQPCTTCGTEVFYNTLGDVSGWLHSGNYLNSCPASNFRSLGRLAYEDGRADADTDPQVVEAIKGLEPDSPEVAQILRDWIDGWLAAFDGIPAEVADR